MHGDRVQKSQIRVWVLPFHVLCSGLLARAFLKTGTRRRYQGLSNCPRRGCFQKVINLKKKKTNCILVYATMRNADQRSRRNRCPVWKREIFQCFALDGNFTARSKKKYWIPMDRETYRVLLMIVAATLSGNCPISTFYQWRLSSNPLQLSQPRSLCAETLYIRDK